MPDLNTLLNASPSVLVGIAIYFALIPVRSEKVPIPNWLIPYLALMAGAIAYPSIEGWTAKNFFIGWGVGGFATWFDNVLPTGFAKKKDEPNGANKT